MFYKIKELSRSWSVILHYFRYKEGRNTANIDGYCQSIFSYERRSGLKGLSFSQPYIVSSRVNQELIHRLNNDRHPVLLEGIHCAGIIAYLDKNRKIIVRMHNDEALYYKKLAASENNWLRKFYFQWEAKQLDQYQRKFEKNIPLACVSTTDIELLTSKYHADSCHFIPSFTPWQTLSGKNGIGDYCLYHGNLEVGENIKIAEWLIENVAAKLNMPLRVAGKGAGKLERRYSSKGIIFSDHPSAEALDELITNAHVNLLPSLNSTGLKLKLLHALFTGRHCVTNTAGTEGTHFTKGIITADSAIEMITAVNSLASVPFTDSDREKRQEIAEVYNNETNAAKLNALLY